MVEFFYTGFPPFSECLGRSVSLFFMIGSNFEELKFLYFVLNIQLEQEKYGKLQWPILPQKVATLLYLHTNSAEGKTVCFHQSVLLEVQMVIYPLIQSYAVLVVLLYHLLSGSILLTLVRICTCMTINNMELAKTEE